MKTSIISMAVAGLFAQANPEKDSKGGPEGAHEEFSLKLPAKVASWHEEGKKQGKKVHDAIERGEMFAREVLLVYGNHLGEFENGVLAPAATDFITGYCSAWTNPNTQKSRKTEIKAVFEAFAMGDISREVVVGMQDDPNGEKDAKGKVKQVPLKESHTIREWLMQHQQVKGKEGYRGLVDFAKDLRGPASGRGAGGGANRGPRAVTDKQQGEIEGRIEVMNGNQAHSVVQRGLNQLSKLPNFEVVQFRVIVGACDMILTKSTDEACKKRAQSIRDQAEDMVERIRKAMADANRPAGSTTTEKPKQEAPAIAPKAEAESTAPAPAEEQQKAA